MPRQFRKHRAILILVVAPSGTAQKCPKWGAGGREPRVQATSRQWQVQNLQRPASVAWYRRPGSALSPACRWSGRLSQKISKHRAVPL